MRYARSLMVLEGKGFFIWKISRCENGDPQAIANLAHASQLTHVLIKIADTVYSSNIDDNIGLAERFLHRYLI